MPVPWWQPFVRCERGVTEAFVKPKCLEFKGGDVRADTPVLPADFFRPG